MQGASYCDIKVCACCVVLQARRAAEREEARKRQIAAKEGFMTLLEECAGARGGGAVEATGHVNSAWLPDTAALPLLYFYVSLSLCGGSILSFAPLG